MPKGGWGRGGKKKNRTSTASATPSVTATSSIFVDTGIVEVESLSVEIIRTIPGTDIGATVYPYAAGNPLPNGLLTEFGQEITNVNANYRIVSYTPSDSNTRWSNIGDNGKHSFDGRGTVASESYTVTYEIDAYSAGASPTVGTFTYNIV